MQLSTLSSVLQVFQVLFTRLSALVGALYALMVLRSNSVDLLYYISISTIFNHGFTSSPLSTFLSSFFSFSFYFSFSLWPSFATLATPTTLMSDEQCPISDILRFVKKGVLFPADCAALIHTKGVVRTAYCRQLRPRAIARL